MRIFKNILLVLSTGYIFVYFSEHLFWSRVRPGDSPGGWIAAWIAYSLMAFVFLLIVSHFRVKNIWAIFLAGAVFGWLGEGIIVQTAYDMLPLSISFTGLAWHALITVWIGWYAVRRSLLSPASFSTLKLAAVIGLFSGLWAINWWLEPDGGVSTLAEYAGFSFTTTALVILAYGLANWSATEPFRPRRWVSILILGSFLLFFLTGAVPNAPVAIVVLPILLGLAFLGLRRNQRQETEASVLDTLKGHIPLWTFLTLLALPITSTAVYAFALAVDLRWQTNWILYLITTPLGFLLFGLSLYKILRTKPAP